jgi:PAS domain S-box-containing protein
MRDEDKSREELLAELRALRAQAHEADTHPWTEETRHEVGADEALLAEAERLVHLGSWEWHLASDTLNWSAGLCRIFGVRPEAFRATYQAFLECVHPEDRATVTAINERALRDHAPFEYSYRIVRPDGVVRTVHACGRIVLDRRGGAVRVIGACQDITEGRQAEEMLRGSELRFRAVFENAHEPMLLMNDAGRYVYGNRAACELLGYSREDLTQLHAWDITPAENRAQIPALLSHLLSVGTLSGEYTFLCKGGATCEVEFRSVANVVPGLHLAVHRDVSERKRAERALRDSHNLLHAVIEGIPDAVYAKDLQGRYIMINSAGARLVGKTIDEVLGRDDTALFASESAERFIAMDRRVMQGGQTVTSEYLGTAAAVTRAYLSSKAPLRGPGGEILGLLGISRDITDRKKSEEALREYSERVGALSRKLLTIQEEERQRLARELHDEIGQLLTSLQFVLQETATAPSTTAPAKLDEARTLIDETLTRVRDLSFDLRPALLDLLGLRPALHALFARFTATTEVRVNFSKAVMGKRFAPELEIAAYRIVQEALTNVARHAQVKEAVVRVWVHSGTLEVQVEDQGVGFDPEAALASGRSSGLPGMHERVMLLGGRLTIQSGPGEGTHLLAQLPLVAHGGEERP